MSRLTKITALLPAVALVSVAFIPGGGTAHIPFGTVIGDGLPAPMADPLEVTIVQGQKMCVEPTDATLEYLDSLIVADNDYSNVRVMPFDSGWDAAEAGQVKVIKACAK